MLDTLTDMEVANTIMRANDKAKDASSVNLLDSRFKDLGLEELAALDHQSDEYKQLQEYLINSSAESHGLKYRLQDIFRVERPGERQRFEKSVKTIKDSNRLLLWHGSRTTNFGGILSQGLRIAPPGEWQCSCHGMLPSNPASRGAGQRVCLWQGGLPRRPLFQVGQLLRRFGQWRCRPTPAG